MRPLEISPNFTIEDIHKIREHNYYVTKNMTKQEKWVLYVNVDNSVGFPRSMHKIS